MTEECAIAVPLQYGTLQLGITMVKRQSKQDRHFKLVLQQLSWDSAYPFTETLTDESDTTCTNDQVVEMYHRIFNMLIMIASFSRRSHPIHAIHPHVWGVR